MECPTLKRLNEYLRHEIKDEWVVHEITNHLCKCDKCLDIVLQVIQDGKKVVLNKK